MHAGTKTDTRGIKAEHGIWICITVTSELTDVSDSEGVGAL